MSTITWIVVSTALISSIAFIGAVVLALKEHVMNKILLVFVAFSAGALVGSAFLHLLPEAIHEMGRDETALLTIFASVLVGYCVFCAGTNHSMASSSFNCSPENHAVFLPDITQ